MTTTIHAPWALGKAAAKGDHAGAGVTVQEHPLGSFQDLLDQNIEQINKPKAQVGPHRRPSYDTHEFKNVAAELAAQTDTRTILEDRNRHRFELHRAVGNHASQAPEANPRTPETPQQQPQGGDAQSGGQSPQYGNPLVPSLLQFLLGGLNLGANQMALVIFTPVVFASGRLPVIYPTGPNGEDLLAAMRSNYNAWRADGSLFDGQCYMGVAAWKTEGWLPDGHHDMGGTRFVSCAHGEGATQTNQWSPWSMNAGPVFTLAIAFWVQVVDAPANGGGLGNGDKQSQPQSQAPELHTSDQRFTKAHLWDGGRGYVRKGYDVGPNMEYVHDGKTLTGKNGTVHRGGRRV